MLHFSAEFSDVVLHFSAEFSDVAFRCGAEFSDVAFCCGAEFSDVAFCCGAEFSDVAFCCGVEFSDVGLGGDVPGHGIADCCHHGFGLSFFKPDFFESLDRGMSVKRERRHGVHPVSYVLSLSRPSGTSDETRRFPTFAVGPRSSVTRLFGAVTVLPGSIRLHGRSWSRCLWRGFDRHRCGPDPVWRFG